MFKELLIVTYGDLAQMIIQGFGFVQVIALKYV
jgi:hypothetical protein